MANVQAIIVCILIIIMDGVAGILGLQAEEAQKHGKHIKMLFVECKKPVHEAYQLGIAATVLLTMSHAIANLLGGCFCVCTLYDICMSSTKRLIATITLFASLLTWVSGFGLLIIAAMPNSKSKGSCSLRHRSFFYFGGILCFIHGLVSIVFYLTADAIKKEEAKPQRSIA
ncbi:hypothetical protein LUZ63_000588 [Rhynchospora breviuscula]|uniref:Uncharacterized protein n=1 Tax=Rhynchospora breviuscula TaxID=2022672 RepID=A0A9Q0CV76_9POAL|nr:hypothetical protein LUZ63_000588 [Rhynchospora breviuscula]